MDICVDFDGTCVSHEFPKMGKDIGAVPVLKKLIKSGHNIILFTMRGNNEGCTFSKHGEIVCQPGYFLQEAIDWFSENNIPLHGINENPDQRCWTNSPKAYGQLYIDDNSLGCPLKHDSRVSEKPFVDWVSVEILLKSRGIL